MALDDDNQQPKRIKTWKSTLPTDITVEILCRLPVESVLRCKSVCKSWYSLTSDPHFVKSHLAISTRNNDYAHHRTLIYSTYITSIRDEPIIKLKTCNLRDVLNDNSSINNALELDYPFEHPSCSVSVAGSCNGLVCIAVDKDVLFICNPSTRISYMLPPSGCFKRQFSGYVVYGFGYQESTDDYKVVQLYREVKDRETLVRIYSLKSRNWKDINGVYPHVCSFSDSGKFSNGALHWIAGSIIVSLDLEKETYGEVLQPDYDEIYRHFKLGTLREQLCVLCDYPGIRADVWVMKVYGVKDSWTKLVSIPYLKLSWRERLLRPLCMSNDGKMLLQSGRWRKVRKLIVYDSNNSSFSEFQNIDGCLGACTFVESLVSPMPPAAALGDI